MSMKRRTNLEIVVEILSLCMRPQTRTRVMGCTNLSWKVTQKYLSRLKQLELLNVHHSSISFVTSRKGLKLLEKAKHLLMLLDSNHTSTGTNVPDMAPTPSLLQIGKMANFSERAVARAHQ